jgi:hypothetical protein
MAKVVIFTDITNFFTKKFKFNCGPKKKAEKVYNLLMIYRHEVGRILNKKGESCV